MLTEEKFNGGAIEASVSGASVMLDFTLGRMKVLTPTDQSVAAYLKNAQLTPWIVGSKPYTIINVGSYTIFIFDWTGNYTGIEIAPNQVGEISLANSSAEQGDLWRCRCRDLLSGTTTTSTTSTTSTTTTPTTTSTTPVTTTPSSSTGTLFTGTWGDPDDVSGGSSEDPRVDPNYTHLPIFEEKPTPFGVLGPKLPEYRLPLSLSVSVVVTAINEGPDLEMTLGSLSRRLRAQDRIVVVDDGSIEPLRARVRAFELRSGIEVVYLRHERRRGCAASRDAGSRAISADLYVFVDSHMTFPENWLDEILAAHAVHPNAILCPISADLDAHDVREGGHWGTNADLYFHAELGIRSHWAPINVEGKGSTIRTPAIMGACYAVSRPVLRAIGGWSMGLRGWGFDEEFACVRAWLLGYEVRLVASTYAAHRYTRDFEAIARVDTSGSAEDPWVLTYTRAYANYVLFGEAIWVGTDEDIRLAAKEAGRFRSQWEADREFLLARKQITDAEFWSLMNQVRADANVQIYGRGVAHADAG